MWGEVERLEERTVAGTRGNTAVMWHASCNKQFHF